MIGFRIDENPGAEMCFFAAAPGPPERSTVVAVSVSGLFYSRTTVRAHDFHNLVVSHADAPENECVDR